MSVTNAGHRSFRNSNGSDGIPFWVSALTAGLLAVGFTRERYAASSPARDGRGQAAREHGRGRLAFTPSEIPPRGWKDILPRVWNNIGEDRVMLVAAGVTFYSLLAIFPAIAALVAIYGFFADPSSIAAHADSLSGVLPSGALDLIRQEMNRVAAQGPSKLGVAFIVGFAVSLWSANAGMKSIFDALNLVYNGTCSDCPNCAVAHPPRHCRAGSSFRLPPWPEPPKTTMALDHLG
jgi:membrane protein